MASQLLEDRHQLQTTTMCPACGASGWNYNVTYTTYIKLLPSGTETVERRHQSREEIRCAHCGKKAVISADAGVRETEAFKKVRQAEDEINGIAGQEDQSDLHNWEEAAQQKAA